MDQILVGVDQLVQYYALGWSHSLCRNFHPSANSKPTQPLPRYRLSRSHLAHRNDHLYADSQIRGADVRI